MKRNELQQRYHHTKSMMESAIVVMARTNGLKLYYYVNLIVIFKILIVYLFNYINVSTYFSIILEYVY